MLLFMFLVGVLCGVVLVLAVGCKDEPKKSPWSDVTTPQALHILYEYEIKYLDEPALRSCKSIASRILSMPIGKNYQGKPKQ